VDTSAGSRAARLGGGLPQAADRRLRQLPSGPVAEKRYLFTPGPTPVPPEVLAALAEPVVHHRGPDYRAIFGECLARLGEVFRTASDVLLFTSSGTGAMESAVANLCSPRERVVVVSAGAFGERWRQLATAYGCDVAAVEYEWGETPRAEDLGARLAELGGAKAVFLTHSETSTGVVCDLQALAAAAKAAGALVVVDGVSSLGAVPLETDAWGLDVVASGSQKALMTPPGIGLCAVSEAAWAALGSSPRYYFDWERTRAGQSTLDSAFTPAVSLVRGLNVALGLLLAEGLEAAFDRHVRLGRACREGAKAMGLELFSPDEDRSAVVTAILTPDGVDAQELRLTLRDRYGVTVAGGHGELKSRLFRIGHIGYYDVFDVTAALAAVELALVDAGADVERGAAVARALDAYAAPVRV
jgi:serine---pyruvate transaminase